VYALVGYMYNELQNSLLVAVLYTASLLVVVLYIVSLFATLPGMNIPMVFLILFV
jgi:hypothetical protein